MQNGSNAVFAFRIQGDVFPAILDADVRWDQVSSSSPSVPITNVSRVLSISDVQRQDAGIYTVTVRNAAGVSSLNFSLNVYGKGFCTLSAHQHASCCTSCLVVAGDITLLEPQWRTLHHYILILKILMHVLIYE